MYGYTFGLVLCAGHRILGVVGKMLLGILCPEVLYLILGHIALEHSIEFGMGRVWRIVRI